MKMILLIAISCIFLSCNDSRNKINVDKVFLSKDSYGFRVVIDSIYVTTKSYKTNLNNIEISGFPYSNEEMLLKVENVCCDSDKCKISIEYESGIIPTFYFHSENSINFSSQSDSIQKEQLLTVFKERLFFYFNYKDERIQLEPSIDFAIIIIDNKTMLTI